MKIKYLIATLLTGTLVAGEVTNYLTLVDEKLQFNRPNSKDGINIFETYDQEAPEFDGLVVKVGGHFTQQFQGLNHESGATVPAGATSPVLDIGNGFNLATANLTLDAQLADGIRMNLIAYLSSRHHSETWVKAGYLQIDRSPVDTPWLNSIMDHVSLRVGHMEINYGDMHFRRSDNANALYNPFVGNLIMDAFATEIGAEVYGYAGSFFGMIGVTDGEIKGGVDKTDQRAPSIYGKAGFDQQINDDLRVRLTGSFYTTSESINNTLYSGDRSGSRYYLVVEPPSASTSTNFTSGRFNPGFTDKVTSFVINPFVKYGGLELFGNLEWATGQAGNATDSTDRTWSQYAGEIVYRFLEDEKVYCGIRYNHAQGELVGQTVDASIDRLQLATGWFINKYILLKAEYVIQEYKDFTDVTDLRHGGKFDGFMIEAVVGF